MAYTIIVILASNMMKFIPFTGMQKEDHLTIAIWISCFQSVFAWIYFHFHLRAPTCHFEIWSSWLMLPARKSCQWCWQSFFCQLISVPASPEQQSAIHSQPEGVTTSHWWFFICCGFHGVSCSSRSTPTSTWLMSFWCFLHRLLMFHASGFSARRGALSSLACSWFIDNICIEYQISCSFIHNQYFSMRQLFINHWWVTMNQTYTCFMADDFHVDRTGGNPKLGIACTTTSNSSSQGKTSCGLRDFSCSAFWSCRSMSINPFFLDGFYKLPNKLGFGSSMDLSLGQSTPGPRFLKKSNCSSRYSGLLNRARWCFPDTSDRRKSWHECRDRATDLFRDSFTLSHGSESAEALGFPLLQFCISNISSTVPFGPRRCG